MSNFTCEQCGAICYDSPSGYTSGCEHYPLDAPLDFTHGEPLENVSPNTQIIDKCVKIVDDGDISGYYYPPNAPPVCEECE